MRILLAVDGSSPSLLAARFVRRLFHEMKEASVVVVHVEKAPSPLSPAMGAGAPDVAAELGPEAPNARAAQLAEAAQRAARGAAADACALLDEDEIPFELEVGPGDPAEMIIDRAQQHHCDLIVMGARGLGALRAAVLGSVSDKVARTSGIPVTLVS